MALIKRKNIEFISASRRTEYRKISDYIKNIVLMLIPLIMIFAFFVLAMNKTAEIIKLETETEDINTYLNNSDIISRKEKLDEQKDQMQQLEDYKINVENAHAILSSYAEMETDDAKTILELRGEHISIKDVGFSEGILTFTGVTDTYREAAEYAGRLKASGKFEDVYYSGFALNVNEEAYTGTADAYEFNIGCKVINN